jgi:large subunit ribosomal protein L17
MQHNRAGRKLGRTTSHRRSLFRNQLASLFTHERITTTLPKAKDLRPLAEKMVTLGKRGGLHARRLALKNLPDQDAVKRLFDTIAPRFTERAGGYTRIMKLGRRPGDGAEMAILELVDFDFATRRAEKVVAEKAAAEKKASLLDRAKRLVTGKGGDKAAQETGKPAEAAESEEAKTETKKEAKKPAKKAAAPAKTTKAPKPAAPKSSKKGGTARTPRKTGGA